MKSQPLLSTLGLATLLLVSVIPPSLAAPPNTGIQGQSIHYTSYGGPTEIAPGVWVSPGDVHVPVATSFTVVALASGRELGRFATGADGGYEIALPPGKYVIVPDPLDLGLCGVLETSPIEVTVKAKQFTAAWIFYFQDGPCVIPVNPTP